MSLSNNGAPITDKKLRRQSGKVTTLNPNAAEFVPFALRSYSGSSDSADLTSSFAISGTSTSGKALPDQSVSSVLDNSDEEAHQYWHHQLPDDITPDFKVMGSEDSQGINSISFSSLSLTGMNETSSAGNSFIVEQQQESPLRPVNNGNSFSGKVGYAVSSYGEDLSPITFSHFSAEPWEAVKDDQILSNVRERDHHRQNYQQGFINEMFNKQTTVESTHINPLEFLASQFPGFAAESLAEVYFANGGDLDLTIEMLTQLELQVDGGLNQNLNSKAAAAPNLSAHDFPALPMGDGQSGREKIAGEELQQNGSPYWSLEKETMLLFKSSSNTPARGAIDFASAVRKMASQDSGVWKYDRNISADASVGSSHVLASSYSGGQGRTIHSDRLHSRGSARAAPVWLETGEAVANMYSEMREEARDHARLRNAFFEQARQAYLIGNKALAKELSVKGQLHNMQMKAAHGKAQESIYRQRNPVSADMQGNGRGPERIIDLHGLHVNEAIHVLKRELTILRSTARSVDQRMQVYICVGTGHHTRGSRSLARLPIAVQHYLLEEEGLDYSEPQPGMLRVVIY